MRALPARVAGIAGPGGSHCRVPAAGRAGRGRRAGVRQIYLETRVARPYLRPIWAYFLTASILSRFLVQTKYVNLQFIKFER